MGTELVMATDALMQTFVRAWTNSEFVQAPLAQIPWCHDIAVLKNVRDAFAIDPLQTFNKTNPKESDTMNDLSITVIDRKHDTLYTHPSSSRRASACMRTSAALFFGHSRSA